LPTASITCRRGETFARISQVEPFPTDGEPLRRGKQETQPQPMGNPSDGESKKTQPQPMGNPSEGENKTNSPPQMGNPSDGDNKEQICNDAMSSCALWTVSSSRCIAREHGCRGYTHKTHLLGIDRYAPASIQSILARTYLRAPWLGACVMSCRILWCRSGSGWIGSL